MSATSGSGPVRAWKFLDADGRGMISRLAWPQPEGGQPGRWVEAGGPLELCERGVHACRLDDLAYWISAQLWELELEGEMLEDTYTLVAERGRLVRAVSGWPDAGPELAEWAIWRNRDRAVTLLDGVDPARAAALAQARTLAELRAAVPGPGTDMSRADQVALSLLDYQLINPDNAVTACVGGAHSAANLASVTGSRDGARLALAEERLAQSRWLSQRLALSA